MSSPNLYKDDNNRKPDPKEILYGLYGVFLVISFFLLLMVIISFIEFL